MVAGRCAVAVWGQPSRGGVELAVVGSWDDDATPVPLRTFDETWRVAELELAPGVYGYEILEEGRGRLDPYNPLTTFRTTDGREVSRLTVPDCAAPRWEIDDVTVQPGGGYEVRAHVVPAATGDALDVASLQAADEQGGLAVAGVDADAGAVTFVAEGRARGKHHVTLQAADDEGRVATRTIAAWSNPVAARWDDGIVYQIMIDRFRGDGGGTLADPADLGARAGGTLSGITAELQAGYFERLGVSALWLTPVYVNPLPAREGRFDGHLYEGYHGYWPLDSRGVEPRIGGDAGLRELVDAAHDRGIRVLLDLVPNHLYEDNPRVAEHRADGWFNEREPLCVCGAPDCSWGEFIGTCWFTDYLPDLRLEHPDAMDSVVDDAAWWLREHDVDGFRIDAVPMMPRAATRRIVDRIRQEAGTREQAFAMGEIFTGAGAAGTADIRYYMGPDGLDSAFDFPLMWALRSTLAGNGTFSSVEASLAETDRALDGAGAVVGRMIGNHDVTRFSSEVAGDADADPWDDPPPQSDDDEVLAAQRIALAIVLTLPGLPVIYYGDEIALAGGNDPDNRRVMPATGTLSSAQIALLADVQRVAQTRRCLPALRRGDRTALVVTDDTWAYARDADDGAPAFVVASRAETPQDVTLPGSAVAGPGWYRDVVSGDMLQIDPVGGGTVAMAPRSVRVYIPADHPCAGP